MLREGVVKDEYLQRPFLPSAPLRAPPPSPPTRRGVPRVPTDAAVPGAGAFSYTQAGGNTSCGRVRRPEGTETTACGAYGDDVER